MEENLKKDHLIIFILDSPIKRNEVETILKRLAKEKWTDYKARKTL